jgi:hypothetical protein
VIVFDLLEAKAADNTVQEGPRKVLGVMHKDSRKYKDTGGWGYEGFKGDSMTERAVGECRDRVPPMPHRAEEQ